MKKLLVIALLFVMLAPTRVQALEVEGQTTDIAENTKTYSSLSGFYKDVRKVSEKRKNGLTALIPKQCFKDVNSLKEVADGIWNRAISEYVDGEERSGYYLLCSMNEFGLEMSNYDEDCIYVVYNPVYSTTKKQEKEVDKKLEEYYNAYPKDSKLNIICTMGKFVRDNIEFGGDQHSGYAALVEGQAVCSGIAAVELRILKHYGIECFPLIYEHITNPELTHVLVAVKLKGKWSVIDDANRHMNCFMMDKSYWEDHAFSWKIKDAVWYDKDDLDNLNWYSWNLIRTGER